MTDQLDAARRLYDAFAERDAEAILAALDEQFVGTVSAGMPLGVGGRHEGPITMLRDVWGPIFLAYEMRVEAERYYPSGDDHVIAVGRYRGHERTSGRAVWPRERDLPESFARRGALLGYVLGPDPAQVRVAEGSPRRQGWPWGQLGR